MSGASSQHLDALYACSEDPWEFDSNRYEIGRLDAIEDTVRQFDYAAILELGCGNGALARRLVCLTRRYVGVDAVARAIEIARRRVPTASFVQAYLPSTFPVGRFDLVVLSEILYFLDAAGLRALAYEIRRSTPDAELLCVNYLGASGHSYNGPAAFRMFCRFLGERYRVASVYPGPGYRIDRLLPVERQ